MVGKLKNLGVILVALLVVAVGWGTFAANDAAAKQCRTAKKQACCEKCSCPDCGCKEKCGKKCATSAKCGDCCKDCSKKKGADCPKGDCSACAKRYSSCAKKGDCPKNPDCPNCRKAKQAPAKKCCDKKKPAN